MNHQLTDLGAVLDTNVLDGAPRYRPSLLPNTVPAKPWMMPEGESGAAIQVEAWRLSEAFGPMSRT